MCRLQNNVYFFFGLNMLTAYAFMNTHYTGKGSGARPTKHISIEFEIRWKFKTL